MTDQIAPDIDPDTLPAALVELRQARAEIGRLRPFVDMADQAARAAERMRTVQGRCPACRWTTLFLGDGGHVTCSRLECPEPEAADRMLHGEWGVAAAADTAPDIWAQDSDGTWTLPFGDGYVNVPEHITADERRRLAAELRKRLPRTIPDNPPTSSDTPDNSLREQP